MHPVFVSQLCQVINLSLLGIVTDDLKSSRVVPLKKKKKKKNDKTEVSNYRPVSISSIISKVFERVVYDQIETYLDERNNTDSSPDSEHGFLQTLV